MRRGVVVAVCLSLAACAQTVGAQVRATFPRSTIPKTTLIAGPVPQAGCPPPPAPPRPPTTPWHPSVLIPDAKLPAPLPATPWTSHLDAVTGKGMWVWQWDQTESGNADAIVARASQAGLHQVWLRVGDSKNGFYGKGELDALVERAHTAGLSVIAWGFPYLYDPVRDASWTTQVLAWRSPHRQGVDGFSADLERSTEGVAMSALRAGVYLDRVRRAAGDRLVVATVYPPLDAYWAGDYPYRTMAAYVDAFAPMEYWECVDPGADAIQALQRLGALKPVHLIGQAFNMADSGGRQPPPSAAEINRFLAVGRHAGAVGVSFWVWNTAIDDEWRAISAYHWN